MRPRREGQRYKGAKHYHDDDEEDSILARFAASLPLLSSPGPDTDPGPDIETDDADADAPPLFTGASLRGRLLPLSFSVPDLPEEEVEEEENVAVAGAMAAAAAVVFVEDFAVELLVDALFVCDCDSCAQGILRGWFVAQGVNDRVGGHRPSETGAQACCGSIVNTTPLLRSLA